MTVFDEKLKSFIANTKRVSNTIVELSMDSLNDKESQIEDLNLEQLNVGIDANSEEIIPKYTERTVEIKKAKGQPFDRVTLKDEGDFHKSITYKVNAKNIEYTATDPKTEALTDKYGEDVLGLNANSKARVKELILEDLADNVRKQLNE